MGEELTGGEKGDAIYTRVYTTYYLLSTTAQLPCRAHPTISGRECASIARTVCTSMSPDLALTAALELLWRRLPLIGRNAPRNTSEMPTAI